MMNLAGAAVIRETCHGMGSRGLVVLTLAMRHRSVPLAIRRAPKRRAPNVGRRFRAVHAQER
jgi:hypothetical protein